MSAPDHFAAMLLKRTAKKKRGFATLSPERQKELSSMGGKRRHELGVGHRFTTEEATIAGIVTGLESTEKMLRSIGANPAEFDSLEQMLDAARKYVAQRGRANERGIGFEITFSEWWFVWKASGHWEQRGRSAGHSYVMSRPGDLGAYRVGNVFIQTLSENFAEYWETAPTRARSRKAA